MAEWRMIAMLEGWAEFFLGRIVYLLVDRGRRDLEPDAPVA